MQLFLILRTKLKVLVNAEKMEIRKQHELSILDNIK